MKKPRKVSQADVKQIREEYLSEPTTMKELADRYHVVESTISRYLQSVTKEERSAKPRKGEKSQEEIAKEKEEQISEIMRLYESGQSIRKIRSKVNINMNEIRNIVIGYLELKEGTLSQKSINMLEGMGYSKELIKKVAAQRKVKIEENEKPMEDEQR